MNKIFTKHLVFLFLFSGTLLSSISAQTCTGNLLVNPGFESNLSNWTNWGALTTSSLAYSGTKAGYVGVGNASGGNNAATAVAGNRYEVRAYAKITAAVSWAGIGITFYDASWNVIEDFDAQITSTNYQQYTISAVAPRNTAHVSVTLWKDVTGELWVDDFCLTTIAPGATMSLGNRLFSDVNGNGLMDVGMEWGIDGYTVVLYADNNNDGIADGSAINTTITSNGGKYNFTGLAAGNYFVQIESVPSWMFLSPRNGGDPDNDIENDNNGIAQNTTAGTIKGGTITLSAGTEPGGINYNSTYDFAVYKYNGLGDFVWLDNNANGQQDAGEQGISGVTVRLKNAANNALLATTTTDAKGFYYFGDPAGIYGVTNYNIEFVAPIGYKPTLPNKIANDEMDSDALNGLISNITVPVGTWNNSFDAGFVPDNITLPVKMVSFTAMLNNNIVTLKWETTNEENFSHFVIEKSNDGRNFENIGIVFSMGQLSGSGSYTFTDNLGQQNNANTFYYRLRSVDNDAKFQLSDTRLIRLSTTNNSTILIAVYPNPVSNEVKVSVPQRWQNKPVAYHLINMAGQTTKQLNKSNASQTETINVSGIQNGIYTLVVKCNGEVSSQKIVKY
jgi:hypothetical protein